MYYNKTKYINQQRIKRVVPDINNKSGIYVFIRYENNIKYAYVGQAKHLLDRLSGHLSSYQHIDLSIKKHGLGVHDLTDESKKKWNILFFEYPIEKLDEMEQKYIVNCANKGFQLYNHTTGSQSSDKKGLKENQRKGYRQGVEYGYNKAKKEIANLFEKHLNYNVKKEGNKNQEKALAKFEEFIEIDKEKSI